MIFPSGLLDDPVGSFRGLDEPTWDIPEGTPIDLYSLGLDDIVSFDMDAFQIPTEVQDVQGRRRWRSQRRGGPLMIAKCF